MGDGGDWRPRSPYGRRKRLSASSSSRSACGTGSFGSRSGIRSGSLTSWRQFPETGERMGLSIHARSHFLASRKPPRSTRAPRPMIPIFAAAAIRSSGTGRRPGSCCGRSSPDRVGFTLRPGRPSALSRRASISSRPARVRGSAAHPSRRDRLVVADRAAGRSPARSCVAVGRSLPHGLRHQRRREQARNTGSAIPTAGAPAVSTKMRLIWRGPPPGWGRSFQFVRGHIRRCGDIGIDTRHGDRRRSCDVGQSLGFADDRVGFETDFGSVDRSQAA